MHHAPAHREDDELVEREWVGQQRSRLLQARHAPLWLWQRRRSVAPAAGGRCTGCLACTCWLYGRLCLAASMAVKLRPRGGRAGKLRCARRMRQASPLWHQRLVCGRVLAGRAAPDRCRHVMHAHAVNLVCPSGWQSRKMHGQVILRKGYGRARMRAGPTLPAPVRDD